MSFSDDLQDDLNNVFFDDYKTTTYIDNKPVIGYLSVTHHQFLDLDTNQHVFSGPIASFPAVKRGKTLVIDGKNYVFVTARPQSQTQNWIVEPA